MTVRQATMDDLDQLSVLFAEYREFYEQPFEPIAAKQFLEERLIREESIIFTAIENEQRRMYFFARKKFLVDDL